MRTRAVLGGVFSSAAILIGAWSLSGAPKAVHVAAAATTTGTTTPGSGTASSGTSGSAGSGSTGGASPAPSSTASAGKASGTYTGSVVSTQYGNVQVQVTLSQGKITDVTALQLTDREGRSVQISNYAAPILRQEVLTAQSASVDTVSGATYTSEGYLTSLQAALDQAG
ncbi:MULTISPECIES: FMN-binding protein [Arthrobacter]|uniref:FMN-binding protein n=2 Tax=Arthrobacter TaxID=1663 RepID=A0ABU9KK83_9MICC|nr:FMN-binding protein [Arthrobacter sp. YJM1]MDP5225973.1 FMN-binding protein [Arthrobacter sp. YJM1]